MKHHRRPPISALALAVLTLVFAVGGTSYAATLITGKDIKNSSITTKDVKDNSLSGADVANGSLTGVDIRQGSVDGVHIQDGSITSADLAQGSVQVHAEAIAPKRVVATAGSVEATARAAAPEIVLFERGALSVVGKCYTAASSDLTFATTYIKSSREGAIFDSRLDTLDGGVTAADFLGPQSRETDRELESIDIGANSAAMDAQDSSDLTALASDGTAIRGWTGAAVKNGNLEGGNGVFGPGNVCLFTGAVFASGSREQS